ncbi:SCAN domain-containing protein 3 [Trichinella patagoniensis]|uniref:SCAN domain-containing protein 3 n=1 Tax=Trichinella patagoniensis TaxID=990121 RepID=A0A0V0Z885_9BILA|nr:SCAN domain-containing protein 3 [Trichinella patagoniensis]
MLPVQRKRDKQSTKGIITGRGRGRKDESLQRRFPTGTSKSYRSGTAGAESEERGMEEKYKFSLCCQKLESSLGAGGRLSRKTNKSDCVQQKRGGCMRHPKTVSYEYPKQCHIPMKENYWKLFPTAPSKTSSQVLRITKDSVPDVLAVHCVIHRQHLVAKHLTERLHCSLGYAIAAISKIRSILLYDRLFSQFCEQNDEEFNRLQMHTEVWWLSKGACLSRYYELFETILEFFQNKDPSLRDSLKKCKSDIAYMADLFFKFNELNLQLQGSELNLIKMRSLISPFISKLAMFKRNLGGREFYQFPSVAALRENGEVHDDDIQIYCDHLDMLQKDMQERFQDILKMKILNLVIDLFSNSNEIEMELKEELIDLQTNEELKPKFKDRYHSFCLQKISDLYPGLWRMVRKFLLAFPSSYLVDLASVWSLIF